MKYVIILLLLITSSFSHLLKKKSKKRKALRERRLNEEVDDLPLLVHQKELELAEVREKVKINQENAETLENLGEFAKDLLTTLNRNYNKGIIEIDAAIVNARSLLEEN